MTSVGDNSPSGPPARLLTRTEKLRRRRAVALSVVIFGSAVVFLTVVTLNLVTNPDTDVQLGSDTFNVGPARTLERRIRTDDFPLLFQDLRGKSIDIWVDHQRGKPFYEAWRAIEAHAPGAPRTCQIEWNGNGFTDPCDGRTYPPSGEGLRRFEARVVQGQVIINFRRTV
jgi:hypothetical protein